jgi:hypothetical protein
MAFFFRGFEFVCNSHTPSASRSAFGELREVKSPSSRLVTRRVFIHDLSPIFIASLFAPLAGRIFFVAGALACKSWGGSKPT